MPGPRRRCGPSTGSPRRSQGERPGSPRRCPTASSEVAAAEQALGAARGALEAAAADQTQALDALHRAELALAAATARAHELVGEHELTDPSEEDAELDPDARAREIEDMERRRRLIGAVNELANTEFAETSERTAEIAEQVADLEGAAAELAAHMQGLDDAVTDGFQQVFDVVQQRFHDAVVGAVPGRPGPVGERRDRG